MTGPVIPPGPEAPEPVVSELHALYREAARAEPGATLDRGILDAARAELEAGRAKKSRRPKPWWRVWLPVASAFAVALVGLSVTWRVMDEQERALRQEMKAAQGAGESSVDTARSVAPAQSAGKAARLPRAPAPAAEETRRPESAVAKDAPPAVAGPAPFPASAAPAAVPPAPAEQTLKKIQRAEADEWRERRDAGAAADSAAPVRQAGKLEARSLGVGAGSEATSEVLVKPGANVSAKSVAGPQAAAEAANPEAWLAQIRDLRAAGRSAEAAQSLARFRARYPDFVLPEDLLNLK